MAVVCLPLLYFLSFGPACWITSRLESEEGANAVTAIYRPLVEHPPQAIQRVILRYAEAGAPGGWMWMPVATWHWERAFTDDPDWHVGLLPTGRRPGLKSPER
jgi:hypothetical protein